MKTRAHFQNSAGSALLLALWALLLLSAVVFAWVKFINANIAIAAEANFGLQARALAHSGVQVAMHPRVSPATPALEQTLGNGSYRVTLTGEGGKLNLNWLLDEKDPKHPIKIPILKKYLDLRGLDFQQRETLVDSLLDWIAPPGSKTQGGGESDNYRPPHRGYLISLDEIKQVKGGDALTSQPGWSDDFTLWSGDGKIVKPTSPIDLQHASQLVLESLPTTPAITDRLAERFIQYRLGPDKIEGTADDGPLTDPKIVASNLGLTPKQYQAQLQINNLVTLNDPTWRAVSVGQAANRTRQVEVVFRKGGQSQILLWKEF